MSEMTKDRAARILDECPWDSSGRPKPDAECCIAADMGARALRRGARLVALLERARRLPRNLFVIDDQWIGWLADAAKELES